MKTGRIFPVAGLVALAFFAGALLGPGFLGMATAAVTTSEHLTGTMPAACEEMHEACPDMDEEHQAQCEAMMEGMDHEAMHEQCHAMMGSMDHEGMHQMCRGMMGGMGNGMMGGGMMDGMGGGMMQGMHNMMRGLMGR